MPSPFNISYRSKTLAYARHSRATWRSVAGSLQNLRILLLRKLCKACGILRLWYTPREHSIFPLLLFNRLLDPLHLLLLCLLLPLSLLCHCTPHRCLLCDLGGKSTLFGLLLIFIVFLCLVSLVLLGHSELVKPLLSSLDLDHIRY